MVIQHNLSAMNSRRQLGINNSATSKNLEKLSSGYKVNRAGDDAAGLAISEKMRGQIRGLEMANQNAQNGIALIQTAEGGCNEIHAILQRMRELAVQSANGTYLDEDRQQISLEITALKNEINRISSSTNYNKIPLLSGTMGGINAIDAKYAGMITGSEEAILEHLKELGINERGTYISPLTASSTADISGQIVDLIVEGGDTPQITLKVGDNAYQGVYAPAGSNTFEDVDGIQHTVWPGSYVFLNDDGKAIALFSTGISSNPLTPNKSSGMITGISMGGIPGNTDSFTRPLISSIIGTTKIDSAHAMYNAVITTGRSELVFQIGANGSKDQCVGLHVDNLSTGGIGINGGQKICSINLKSWENANQAIEVIDAAINKISGTRADLGAMQNRLEHTLNNLGVTKENLTSAESTIRDVDMAKEMMNFTKNNILIQASQSMLAQSNQLPQGVLSLLR